MDEEEGQTTTAVVNASEPPPLPYTLRTRKKSIAIFWILFVIDVVAQPLALYWALWFATDLSHNIGMSPFIAGPIRVNVQLIVDSSQFSRS